MIQSYVCVKERCGNIIVYERVRVRAQYGVIKLVCRGESVFTQFGIVTLLLLCATLKERKSTVW